MKRYKEVWQEFANRNIPILIEGGVGIGKTETWEQIAKEMNRKLVFIHLSRRSNMDFIIPKIDGDKVSYAVSEIFSNIVKEGNTIILFDEFDRADGMTRNAILSLINERKFEHLNLPDSVSIVLLCNQNSSRDTFSLNQAEISRVAYFKMNLDLSPKGWYIRSWVEYAEKKKVDSKIIAYLMNDPAMIHVPSEEVQQFPTPRSWINLSKVFDIIQDKNLERDMKMEIVSSMIGEEMAGKFLTYLDIFSKLPPAEEIIKKRIKYENPSEQVAVIEHLAFYLRENNKSLEGAIDYIESILGGEFLYIFIVLTKNFAKREYMNVIRKRVAVKNIIIELGSEVVDIEN